MPKTGLLSDGIIDLRLNRVERAGFFRLKSYIYDIYIYNTDVQIGRCDYRTENNQENYYGGNIGYMIYQAYRGNHYALSAANLLCTLAKKLKVKQLIITCSPENTASYKTIIKLGGEFLEEATVPDNHYLYSQGERIKWIFMIKLTKGFD